MVRSWPRRGEVYWADFGEPRGSAPALRRPVLIVQNDTGNRSANTVIVVPISSSVPSKDYPFHVRVPDGLTPRPSIVKCEQPATLDKRDLSEQPLALLPIGTMLEVDAALRVSLAL